MASELFECQVREILAGELVDSYWVGICCHCSDQFVCTRAFVVQVLLEVENWESNRILEAPAVVQAFACCLDCLNVEVDQVMKYRFLVRLVKELKDQTGRNLWLSQCAAMPAPRSLSTSCQQPARNLLLVAIYWDWKAN